MNSLIAYALWDDYVSEVDEQTLAELDEMQVTLEELRAVFLYLMVACLVFAVVTFLLKYGVEKKKVGWGWLLGLSIFYTLAGFYMLFSLIPGILCIIASIFYAVSRK